MKWILIVDDERDILDLLRYNLQQEGFSVLEASNGKTALELAQKKPVLIILDIMLPVLDGLEVIRTLKADPLTREIPVIFLTARGTEIDEAAGLELGAEDYLVKPFSVKVLLARVRAVLRQREGNPVEESHEILAFDGVVLNIPNYTMFVEDKEVPLRRKEFQTLVYLARNHDRVVTREELLDAVWGKNIHVVDRTVDVHIRKIREKLGSAAARIETVKGVGYRFRR